MRSLDLTLSPGAKSDSQLSEVLLVSSRRMLWAAPAISLLVELMLLVFGKLTIAQTGRNLLAALTYSTVIGMPSMLAINWINQRYTRAFPRTVILLHASIQFLIATVGCFAAQAVFLLAGLVSARDFGLAARSSYPFIVIFTLLISLVVATYDSVQLQLQETKLALQARLLEKEHAEKLLARAQLSSLESRIHPHFFFNTLNSIAALIPSNPRQAELTVAQLASLLRFSINTQHVQLVPLAQELKIVRDYIEIEKTRFGDRIQCKFFIPELALEIKTPPLALQSIVENVVKHVVSTRAAGATIEIHASIEHGILNLESIDNGPGFTLDTVQPDRGLGNLESRLKLLYGDSAGISVEFEPGRTLVRISHPITEPRA